jgi:hypothetical protein
MFTVKKIFKENWSKYLKHNLVTNHQKTADVKGKNLIVIKNK